MHGFAHQGCSLERGAVVAYGYADGRPPDERLGRQPLASRLASRLGKRYVFGGRFFAVIWCIKGDMDWLANSLGLQHFSSHLPCPWCRCNDAEDEHNLWAMWWGIDPTPWNDWGDDAAWGIDKNIQVGIYGKAVVTDLAPSRYDLVAEGLGAYGELVEQPDEIGPALDRAIDAGRPALLNIMVRSQISPRAQVIVDSRKNKGAF